jgi:UDPglucose--hexose-1-phosphate uridylyltransferase
VAFAEGEARSQLRRDPVTGRPTIIATNRAHRPGAFVQEDPGPKEMPCPFCAGHEQETPAAIATFSLDPHNGRVLDNAAPWHIRIVPNKYPAMAPLQGACDEWPEDFHAAQAAVGVHEVIIESPTHATRLAALDPSVVGLLFQAYRQRLIELAGEDLAYGLVFKNEGKVAGASLEHCHSQILGTAFVPPQVLEELDGSRAYFEKHRACVYCQLIAREGNAGTRIVTHTTHFVAICPFASRFPYEMWLLPRRPHHQFESAADDKLCEFGRLVSNLINRIQRIHKNAAFNYILHTAPFDINDGDYYHWHLEIIPRLTLAAGFEWGSGCFINPVSPEAAADSLRAAGPPAGSKLPLG